MANNKFVASSLSCVCGRKFSSAAALYGHQGHCKEYLGEERFNHDKQRMLKVRNGLNKYHENKRAEKMLKWLSEKHICEYCGKEMTIKYGSGRFCSEKCYRQYVSDYNSNVRFKNSSKCSVYRSIAFSKYERVCAVCGWNDDERILEVHHKDSKRLNNDADNLIILCPTCHRK